MRLGIQYARPTLGWSKTNYVRAGWTETFASVRVLPVAKKSSLCRDYCLFFSSRHAYFHLRFICSTPQRDCSLSAKSSSVQVWDTASRPAVRQLERLGSMAQAAINYSAPRSDRLRGLFPQSVAEINGIMVVNSPETASTRHYHFVLETKCGSTPMNASCTVVVIRALSLKVLKKKQREPVLHG